MFQTSDLPLNYGCKDQLRTDKVSIKAGVNPYSPASPRTLGQPLQRALGCMAVILQAIIPKQLRRN